MTFSLDDSKRSPLAKWLKEHDETCRYAALMKQGAIGGRLTYSFTPTHLGVIVKVQCSCGEECDVTDYDW